MADDESKDDLGVDALLIASTTDFIDADSEANSSRRAREYSSKLNRSDCGGDGGNISSYLVDVGVHRCFGWSGRVDK
jgi:hypothetical protein